MAYSNRRKQKQKKNAIRREREAEFARRREEAKNTPLLQPELLPLILKAASGGKE